jgi:hypothetical protein
MKTVTAPLRRSAPNMPQSTATEEETAPPRERPPVLGTYDSCLRISVHTVSYRLTEPSGASSSHASGRRP